MFVTFLAFCLSRFLVSAHSTAGLRALSPADSESILSSCRGTLSLSGFKFSNENARMLRGEEEGLFAWISANYLLGAFDPSSTMSTVGVVEVRTRQKRAKSTTNGTESPQPITITTLRLSCEILPI